MAEEGGSITRWIDLARQGNHDAVEALWKRYYAQLVAHARKKLPAAGRRAQDEEDVALSAFDTFIRRAQDGSFPQLLDRDGLWSLLLTIASRKAVNIVTYEMRLKRGGGRTVSFNAKERDDTSSMSPLLEAMIATDPSPHFALEVAEEYERLMNSLEDAKSRSIAQLKFEGYQNTEIAQQLDVSLRTVERKLSLIRQKWSIEAER